MTTPWLVALAGLPVAAVWLPGHVGRLLALLGAALLAGTGLALGALAPSALPALLLLYVLAWWTGRRGSVPGTVGFAALALAVVLGVLPGVGSLALSDPQPLKPDSLPYALHLSFAKVLVAVPLLLWLVPRGRRPLAWLAPGRVALLIGLTAGAVLGLGWALGYIHPAPGWPATDLALGWMALNLLVVCPLEEGFFRGLLLRGLARRLPAGAALAISAGLFGLAHAAGGVTLVALASVAGLGYGLVYRYSSQQLTAAIACHFLVNLAHFSLFTYPAG